MKMDKYKAGFTQRVKPKMNHETGEYKVEPFREAQLALGKSQFVSHEREVFFNEAYSEILADLFTAWLKSEPHAQKEREYLYSCAMALGSVKSKLIGIEMYGANMQFMANQNKAQEESEGKEE
jgi:hypothetical protein